MNKIKKTPERMCIACRQHFPKKDLVRIVKDKDGNITLDRTGKLSGRGAYICDNAECIAKCIKYKLLNKHFEMEISQEVYDAIAQQFASK